LIKEIYLLQHILLVNPKRLRVNIVTLADTIIKEIKTSDKIVLRSELREELKGLEEWVIEHPEGKELYIRRITEIKDEINNITKELE